MSRSAAEAYNFLKEIPQYEESGILCRIPNWWKGQAPRLGLAIAIGEQTPAMVGMQALLDFRPRLMLGETELTEEEARRLLKESEGLAFIKNKWVAVDPEKLRQTLAAYAKAKEMGTEEGISFIEAMRWSMNPGRPFGDPGAGVVAGVAHGQWLRTVMERLRRPGTISEDMEQTPVGLGVKATLRGYQEQGVRWLHLLRRLGFGACLADDMGLGKTLRVLAFCRRRNGTQSCTKWRRKSHIFTYEKNEARN